MASDHMHCKMLAGKVHKKCSSRYNNSMITMIQLACTDPAHEHTQTAKRYISPLGCYGKQLLPLSYIQLASVDEAANNQIIFVCIQLAKCTASCWVSFHAGCDTTHTMIHLACGSLYVWSANVFFVFRYSWLRSSIQDPRTLILRAECSQMQYVYIHIYAYI